MEISEELELRTFLRQSSQTTTTVTFPPQAEDLDGYSSQRNTAMSLTEELGLSTATIPVRTMEEDLLALLEERDEDKFIEVAGERGLHEDKNVTSKFLQLACERHLVKIVEFLLKTDVDPNWVTDENSKTPLRIAAEKGFFKVVDLLLDHQKIKVEKYLLSYLIIRRRHCATNKKKNHERCYQKLLSFKGLDVNYKDDWGNYPLYYATRYGGPEVVHDLLERKASLANRNEYDDLTIADCDYETLREHFDECVRVYPGVELDKEDMTISFDYSTLLPSLEKAPRLVPDKMPSQETAPDDEENESCLVNDDTNCLVPETDAVLYMSESPELQPLLNHPLITTFLYAKWYSIRWIFRVSLIFYVMFWLSVLYYIAKYYGERPEKPRLPWLLLTVTSVLLLFRELFQFLVFRKKYMYDIENYIEVALIAIAFYMLFSPSPDVGTRKQVGAILCVLFAFEHLFLMGTTNSVMLRFVSVNFVRYILFYLPLLFAFACCFSLLFHVPERQPRNSTAIQEDAAAAEKQQFFVDPFISLFKIIVMLTGDFDASEINFNQYPVTSHLLFLLFVITIVIVLVNLLNELTVGDIRNKVVLISHIKRAQYIAHAESIMFYLENLHVSKIFKFFCCLPTYQTNYTLYVYPTQKGRIRSENGEPLFKNVFLDKQTVRRAIQLVQTKRRQKDKVRREKEESKRNQKEIVQKLDDLLQTINHLNTLMLQKNK